MLRDEVQLTVVVGGGVGDLVGGVELGELGALAGDARAGRLVGEIDLEAVPAELPADDDGDDAAFGQGRARGDDRRDAFMADIADSFDALLGIA